MGNSVHDVINLINEGEVDKAIDKGLKALRGPVNKIDKANLSHHIGNAFYSKMNIREFIKWQKKAVMYSPSDLWEHRLRCWGNAIFSMHHLPEVTDSELAEAHFHTQEIVKDIKWIYDAEKRHELAVRENNLHNRRKLRIGYISGDFFSSVNFTFVVQLIATFDHSQFEVYAYGLNDHDDLATEFAKKVVTGWRTVRDLSAEDIAKKIYEDKIDILFDISVHCGKSRTLSIVAYKPAPIIIAGIGYMSTSGMKAVDYFLTDVYCDPPGMGDEHFSERLLRLENSHFCFTPREYSKKFHINTKIHENIVFGSLNDYRKLNEEVLCTWCNIMKRVPDSRLLLQSGAEEFAQKAITEKLIKFGFDMSRVEIRPSNNDYFATYNDIDIALDSFPYTGGATTFDALYMGVPVVSRYGTRHGNRFGYSILQNLGLGELTAKTWHEYEDLAVGLAEDRELLAILHKNLRMMLQKSPLMDAQLYVKSLETKYHEIWNRFLQENS